MTEEVDSPDPQELVDLLVEAWHSGDSELPLHEFLGWTWEEYSSWGSGKLPERVESGDWYFDRLVAQGLPDPRVCEHDWEEMHHHGDEGKHYCPTGFMWCAECASSRLATEAEQTCFRWGE